MARASHVRPQPDEADSSELRAHLKFLRERFFGKNMQGQVQVFSNEHLVNCEKVLKAWLNSHEYRRDEDKREFLATLRGPVPMEDLQGLFVLMLLEKVEATRELGRLIYMVLKQVSPEGLRERLGLSKE